jgi:redox-sensitive bicupin YhaK (pirin superfamily)
MLQHRPIKELGGGNYGWLKARHHFAVGLATDNAAHTALGNLIVWNDDEIKPGTGFPEHSHRNMEIITYVRQGVVAHQDNLGNREEIHAGDVQVMSAGTGILHSEGGADTKPTKLYQIWILPSAKGVKPRWGTKPFPKSDRAGRFVVLASGFPDDTEALPIHADARVLGATLMAGQKITYELKERKAYLVPASGKIKVNNLILETGDGLAVDHESSLIIEAVEAAEIVLADIA